MHTRLTIPERLKDLRVAEKRMSLQELSDATGIPSSTLGNYAKDENVDIVNSVSLPVGILENADVELYDKTLDEGDVIVMITDGILDANKAEQPKEKWVLELLKAINPENPQRLADIILQEAMDSNFGIAEDDMTVIVAKVKKQGVQ